MRWRGQRQSTRVEDRRGIGFGRPVAFGGGGIVLLGALLMALLGVDPRGLLEGLNGTGSYIDQQPGTETRGPISDEAGQFVSTVFADLEDTWTGIFERSGGEFTPPGLVLFSDATPSECGVGSAMMGPFYCSRDGKVYIDLSFYDDLATRFGAPGDFAQAYVLAHEVGHHVQNLLGIMEEVQRLAAESSEAEQRALSIRQELQADCLAGVWGYHASQRGLLEPGDAEEGLQAAAAIGDDRIQRQTTGRVSPESWTHGSSEQRLYWLRRGLASGQVDDCDTFQNANP
jgi:predicted metalloprotease